MEIRLRSSGAVMTEQQFRAAHPNTSFPQQLTIELLNEFGADPVLNGAQAQPTRYQTAYRDGVEEINGQWFTKYSVVDMDADAIASIDANQAKSVRDERNRRLSETDWRFRSDMSPSQAWIDYCQALRDLPSQTGFPWEVTWPVEP
jgi:hypothetical protein